MADQLEPDYSNENVRSPAAVTWAVWKALFLREAVSRLSVGRAAWLWLLLEPLVHVAILMLLFEFIRNRNPFGVPGPMFIMTGVLTFMVMRNAFTRSAEAVNANAAFLSFRQVKPVDTVLVRAALEGFLLIIVALLLFLGANLFGYQAVPRDPIGVVIAFVLMWLTGVGMGLVFSVVSSLVSEIGKIVKMLSRPLYIASCVVWPSMMIPSIYRDWIMLNPFAHGVESMRMAFFDSYIVAPQTSLVYLAISGQIIVFFGLALHRRFAKRLIER
jgi:capsular polysaccharide transport system permease protein